VRGFAPTATGAGAGPDPTGPDETSTEEGQMSSPDQPLIDASVHLFFRSDRDLRGYLNEPFRSRGYPDPDVAWFAPPGPRYAGGTEGPGGSHPGSDPELAGRTIFAERGFDYAILHPMSSAAILPDWHLGSAILAATNQMMVERWLDSGTYAHQFRGTIRVNPNDVGGAVQEIQRWRGHPRIVQIGLPMQTQEPYGRAHFKPLWRVACDAGLPVAVHLEMGVGITHPPTPSGITRTYSHHVGYQAMTFVWHLLNMIAEGVFEEFPDLRVVWADGAEDMLTPFMWRMDTFGRPHLEQTPWAPDLPSSYLPEHVYFVHGRLDGPGDAPFAGEWLTMTGKEDMLLFGSSYPDWQLVTPGDLPGAWSAGQRAKVLGGNAARLYGLHAAATAPA
jgi:predicted TIM-barrel fold metal-dependent hydrolase